MHRDQWRLTIVTTKPHDSKPWPYIDLRAHPSLSSPFSACNIHLLLTPLEPFSSISFFSPLPPPTETELQWALPWVNAIQVQVCNNYEYLKRCHNNRTELIMNRNNKCNNNRQPELYTRAGTQLAPYYVYMYTWTWWKDHLTVEIGGTNHSLQLVFRWLHSDRSHHGAQFLPRNDPVSILVEELESFGEIYVK